MSVLSALTGSNKIFGLEEAFQAKDTTTRAMQEAIECWYRLYYDREPEPGEDHSQRLPYAVVSKLARTTFSEYTARPAKDDPFVAGVLGGLGLVRKRAMYQALIGGECLLKPFPRKGGFDFRAIPRQSYKVFARDALGTIGDLGTAETTEAAGAFYTLLERRTVYGGCLTIQSRLYRSSTRGALGRDVPLTTLERYKDLAPLLQLSVPTGSVGLVQVRTPVENCVDGSADGVSVYAPAAGLIRLIAINEAQINGEFQRGESRIVVSGDLMLPGPDGKRRLTDHIFSGVDGAPDEVGIKIFSPAFREQSFLARKQEYLRNMESLIGLKRGILSEVEAAERTATEVTSSAGDYNLTIQDFQQMWEDAVRECVGVCDVLGRTYKLHSGPTLDPDKDVTIDWGNGILYDEEKQWASYTQMVAAGMLRPEIALAWKFSLPWETPEDLAAIREKYMPQLSALVE